MERSDRAVLLSISIALLLITLVTKWHALLLVATLLLFGVLLELRIFAVFASYWRSIVGYIGASITRLALAIIYLAILTPYSLLYRLGNRARVRAYFASMDQVSYFSNVIQSTENIDFTKPW